MDTDKLDALDDDQFIDLVLDAIPAETPATTWDALCAPGIVYRTRRAISELLRDLSDTTRDNKHTMPAHAYNRWLTTEATPTRDTLQERLRQVKQTTLELHRNKELHRRNRDRYIARVLTTAIANHRLASVNAGLEPEPHDRTLWAQLGELTATWNDQELTLNEMLGRGIWGDQRTGADNEDGTDA